MKNFNIWNAFEMSVWVGLKPGRLHNDLGLEKANSLELSLWPDLLEPGWNCPHMVDINVIFVLQPNTTPPPHTTALLFPK